MTYLPGTWSHNGTTYTVEATYIDRQTGEILKKKDAKDKSKYVKIKSTKKTEYNANRTRATVRYIIECTRQPQQEFNLD